MRMGKQSLPEERDVGRPVIARGDAGGTKQKGMRAQFLARAWRSGLDGMHNYGICGR